MNDFKVAVAGAGAIGRAHVETIKRTDFASLSAIADPTEAGRKFAEEQGVPWYADPQQLLDRQRPDAMIVATPNNTHLPITLAAIDAGVAVLVEKPVASSVAEGEAMADASEKANVPVLVGHHRRHNPIIKKARSIVSSGKLGTLTNVSVLSAFFKPDEYFDIEWRRQPGGGPVLINLIHEIDLIRHICGEIAEVHALASSAVRHFAVEDTAAVLLRLVNGALVTISLSDTAVSPWAYDLSSGEISNYPKQPKPLNSHFISGTEASLTLPTLEYWHYTGKKGWYEPMTCETLAVDRTSPYVEQLLHLRDVARGTATPLISARDATQTLRATLAVSEAARTRRAVNLT